MTQKSGLSRQVTTYRRFICIQNVILGYDKVASHGWLLIAGSTVISVIYIENC